MPFSPTMTLEYVSEVDRKFLANNLLTKEDWETSMEGFEELDAFLELNHELNSFTDDLPEDFMTIKEDSPPPIADTILDDYWNEFNCDSADSRLFGIEVKAEPLSPASSNCSETGSEGYGSASDVASCVQQIPTQIKIEDASSLSTIITTGQLPVSSSSTTLTTSASNRVFTIIPKQEDNNQAIILNNINGNSVGMLTPVNGGAIKLNNIMNSKIKIQPKPCETSSVKMSPATSKITSTKPLVLTPEEFTKLTSSGALCFQPPGNSPVAMDTSETIIPSQTVVECTEVKNVKRQQRMIKNRESASLSRKKKKEYLSTLEARLNGSNTENQKLKQENGILRKKMCALQEENERLKQHNNLPSHKKTTTCLLAILVMLSINVAPWSLLRGNENIPATGDIVTVHKGRQLMSLSDTGNKLRFEKPASKGWSQPADMLMRQLHKLTEEMGSGGNRTNINHQMCPTYFNKTESILLAEQLAGWMIRHEEEKQKTHQKKRTDKKKVKTLNAALRGDVNAFQQQKRLDDQTYQIQLFRGADNRQDFLNAIHRRNDTFYVLSFDQDYFLVPATAHNKTMRPRMSLVMPAMTLNETMQPPEGSVGMMQIDCEVVSTQLIHVHKSVIPPHHKKNSTFNRYRRSREDFP